MEIAYYPGCTLHASSELYDIQNDIGETVNLVYSVPEKAKELLNELRQWRREVGAQMPTLNPNYDPDRVHEWRFFRRSSTTP